MRDRVNGVMFGGKHSYYDYGMWLSARPDVGTPVAKTITVEIPGADGVLDLTESTTGEAKYSNRQMELVFAIMLDVDDQAAFKSMLMDDLHGKVLNIVLDEDSEWVYRGRCSVTFEDIMPWKMKIKVNVDANPYKTALHDTLVDFAEADYTAANKIKLADNVSDVPYRTVFKFPTPIDLERFDSVTVAWNVDTATSWGRTHEVKIIDSSGGVFTEQITFNAGSITFSNSDIEGWNIAARDVIQIELDNIGGGSITGKIENARLYPVYNERLSVAPRWMVSGSSSITCWCNGVETVLAAGDSRSAGAILKAGRNDIVLFDSTAARVQMVFRKGRL